MGGMSSFENLFVESKYLRTDVAEGNGDARLETAQYP